VRIRGVSCSILGLLAACQHARPGAADDAGPAAPALATSARPAPSAPDARTVIEQWNRLHNDHDSDRLASLYAPRVTFYGASLSRDDCAKKKRLAFAATPDYAQSTRDATLEPAEAGRTFVRLVKTSTTKGKSTDYSTILVIDANGDIVEESDDLPGDWCIDRTETMLYPIGNDRVVAPFRMSASDAMRKARLSKHLQSLSKTVGDMAVACARRCAIQTHACGFSFTLHDMDRHGADDPTLTVSSWMGTVEVEPVTKTLWWEDHASDGASVWHSEPL
jgi:hypothetical protein